MISKEKYLSDEGLTITPRQNFNAVIPPYGMANCAKALFRFSPEPKIVGKISDIQSFSAGPDLHIGGIVIKHHGSKRVTIPKELLPFYEVIRTCVSNEFALDPDASTRLFFLTISRANARAGEAIRSDAAVRWHRHWPARADRATKIQTTRSYLAADKYGTEVIAGCYTEPNSQRPPLEPTHVIPVGHIGLITSFSFHRTPLFPEDGRRTVFILSSYAKHAETNCSPNPMDQRLSSVNTSAKIDLLRKWRQNERSILRHENPFVPPPRNFSRSMSLGA